MSDEQKADAEQKKEDSSSEQKQKTWTDDEVQKIIKERDTAKKKAQAKDDAEKAATEAKMIEEGKTKELLAQREAELAEAKKKADEYDLYKASKRNQLLSRLSDDDKEFAVDMNLDKLEKFVDKQLKQTTQQASPPSGQWKHGTNTPMPKFRNADERAKWLIAQGLAV
jgi:hypothetical protein